MQSQNPLFADLAKLLNSAAGTVAGAGREARESARERFREAMGGLDFVSREEFDVQAQVLLKTREKVEILEKQVKELLEKKQKKA